MNKLQINYKYLHYKGNWKVAISVNTGKIGEGKDVRSI